jgi:hypothetical protein
LNKLPLFVELPLSTDCPLNLYIEPLSNSTSSSIFVSPSISAPLSNYELLSIYETSSKAELHMNFELSLNTELDGAINHFWFDTGWTSSSTARQYHTSCAGRATARMMTCGKIRLRSSTLKRLYKCTKTRYESLDYVGVGRQTD